MSDVEKKQRNKIEYRNANLPSTTDINVDKLIVRTRDPGNDPGQSIILHIPSSFGNLSNVLFDTGRKELNLPFATVRDFQRSIFGVGIRWYVDFFNANLAEPKADIESLVGALEAGLALIQEEHTKQRFADVIAELEQTINFTIEQDENGNSLEARVHCRDLVDKFRASIAGQPSGYWRDLWLERIDLKFREILADKTLDTTT